MNKQYTVFTILGILVLAVAGYVAFTFIKDKESSTNKNDTSILLYVESGDVSFKNADETSFVHATTSPITLSNNSHVHTGIGKAAILFPDNSSVTLDQYTELEVKYDNKHLTLIQTLGTTYNRVQALVTGASYEVATPGTLAAVRGTKFAVSYDKKTKVSKVAVTEHAVLVSRLDANGSSTQETLVSEGKLAKVDEGTDSSVAVMETETDADMKLWIEANIERDNDIDFFMQNGDGNIRESLETLFESDQKNPASRESEEEAKANDTTTKPSSTTRETTTTPTSTKKESTTTTNTTTTNSSTGSSTTSSSTVKKLDEETFFDRFNALFISYFYLDEKDTPCTFNVTPASRVRIVTSFASESGYPFTSKTLLDFATDIDAYCVKKDASTKKELQARFDVEFPFQEDI